MGISFSARGGRASLAACALALLALLLAACALPFEAADVPAPPEALAYTPEQDEQLDALLGELERSAAALFRQSDFTISAQQAYTTTLTLDAVAAFYAASLPEQGWLEVSRVPPAGADETMLAYQRRDQLVVVAAINARGVAGAPVLVYTILAQR